MKTKLIGNFFCVIFDWYFEISCIKVFFLSVVGLGVSKGRSEPSANSPADVLQENPSEVGPVTTHLVEVTEVTRKEVTCKEQETITCWRRLTRFFLQKTPPFLVVTTITNVKEKVVIGSRRKKYPVCQLVAVTNLPIAGCLIRAFLFVKQQVFFG